jgi:uncharacterized membrane protein
MAVATKPPVTRATSALTAPADEGTGWTVSLRSALIALGGLLLAVNVLLAAGIYIPFLSPALGALAVLGVPTLLLYLADLGGFPAKVERLIASLVLALLLIMGAGLLANTILPHLGIANPLGGLWTVLTVDVLTVLIVVSQYRRYPTHYRIERPGLGGKDQIVVALGALAVALSVMGAFRLNNGAGGGLTLVMLVLVMVILGLLVLWRATLNAGVIPVVIYLVGLALLLMTSLRGWYTTGHDVQLEFRVFELTKVHASWNISRFQDAYNACLSITILPTMLSRFTRVADPYIYKVFFQILFATCPVLVYQLARRVAPIGPAVVATIYFVAFVTFSQDMPMLNRQEIAFLFLVVSLLALFNNQRSVQSRRAWFCVFGAGMVVSHYSTTYMMIGVLAVAWGLRLAVNSIPPVRRLIRPAVSTGAASRGGRRRGSPVLGIGIVVAVGTLAFLWTTPFTHTEKGLSATVSAALDSVRGSANAGAKSSDTSNSFFGGNKPSPAQQLAEYQKENILGTAHDRMPGKTFYYDPYTVARYPTPVVDEVKVPVTGVGRALGRVGIDVAVVNTLVRQAFARLLQIFIGIGLLLLVFARRRTLHPPGEFYYLAVANLIIVVVQVVLPVLSVNYGLLRAFQQSLIVLDVFLVAGTLALVPKLFGGWRKPMVVAIALVFFASSTGVMTQVLGGYQPQLHLNNAGTYYDIYYLHPQEIAAMSWIKADPTAGLDNIQSEIQTDRYNFSPLGKIHAVETHNDIIPSLIRRDSFVFLGYSDVNNRVSTVPYGGDLITYQYPMSFLDDNKDLVYSSNGARVYR